MVTEHMPYQTTGSLGHSLAKILMVTELRVSIVLISSGHSLAKILMVTERKASYLLLYFGHSLAKILMVTEQHLPLGTCRSVIV